MKHLKHVIVDFNVVLPYRKLYSGTVSASLKVTYFELCLTVTSNFFSQKIHFPLNDMLFLNT